MEGFGGLITGCTTRASLWRGLNPRGFFNRIHKKGWLMEGLKPGGGLIDGLVYGGS